MIEGTRVFRIGEYKKHISHRESESEKDEDLERQLLWCFHIMHRYDYYVGGKSAWSEGGGLCEQIPVVIRRETNVNDVGEDKRILLYFITSIAFF